METRFSLSPESRHGDEARHWTTFSDVALAMLLVFVLFILAQFLQYERIFVLEEIDRRKQVVAQSIDNLAAQWQEIQVIVEDEDELRQRIRISGNGELVFEPCLDELRPDGADLMENIGVLLGEYPGYFAAVEVEGHADRQAATGIVCVRAGIQDNWQLSARRATEVVRVFSRSQALPNTLLSAVGKGEFHPLSAPSDTTQEALRQDRRIEIVLRYSEDIFPRGSDG